MYIMGMGRKLSRLEEDLKKQPSTLKGIEQSKSL